MSDLQIYGVIDKLASLSTDKTSTPLASVYDEVTAQGTILEGIKMAEAKKVPSISSDERFATDPKVAKLMTKARFDRPQAKSDLEALVFHIAKQDDALEASRKAEDAMQDKLAQTQNMLAQSQQNYNNQENRLQQLHAKVTSGQISDVAASQQAQQIAKDTAKQQQQVRPEKQTTYKAPAAAPSSVPTPFVQPTAVTQPAPVAPATAQPAPNAAVTKPTRTYKPIAKTPASGTYTPPSNFKLVGNEPKNELPPNVIRGQFGKGRGKALTDVGGFEPIAVGQNESKLMNNILKENIKLLTEYKEGDPNLGIFNYNDMLKRFQSGQQKVTLDFGAGKTLMLYDYQMYGLLADLGSDQNQERKVQRIETTMSSYDNVVNALMQPKVKKYIAMFPEFAKKSPIFKARTRDIEQGKFQLEPTTVKDPGEVRPQQSHPYQQSDSQLEENVGKFNMSDTIQKIAENLMDKFLGFKQKLDEDAKPDFLDLDDDGDTDEPMKDAAKDAEPDKTDKSKAEKRKRLQALKDKKEDEADDDWFGGKEDKPSTRKIKGKAYGGSAQKDDEDKDDLDEVSYSAKAARAGKDIGKPGKAFAKIAKSAGERYGSKERGEKVAGAVLKKLRANEGEEVDESGLQAYLGKKKYGKEGMKALQKAGREGASKEKMALIRAKHDKMDEVAPPGAKAERMVKHIKKGYAKDGKLTPKEKGIAYATAWKAHNKGKLQESRDHGGSEYTYETVARVLCDENPHMDVNLEEFRNAVYDELIQMKMTPKSANWLLNYDEDFLGDCATSYNHFCRSKEKEMTECGNPMNSFVQEDPVIDAVQELDEIARLAGLPTKEATCEGCGCEESSCQCQHNEAIMDDEMGEGNAFTGKLAATAKGDEFELDGKKFKDTSDLEEEVASEGNEFSGALAAAKAAGEKEFEVDGKKYTVKEDINLNVSATGEEDVVNLIRKLSGMPVVAIQAQPAVAEEVVAEEGPKERDVEYTNTPREEVAGVEAAIPPGADLNRAKRQFKKEYPGDNPMAVKEEQLWTAYESLINELKD